MKNLNTAQVRQNRYSSVTCILCIMYKYVCIYTWVYMCYIQYMADMEWSFRHHSCQTHRRQPKNCEKLWVTPWATAGYTQSTDFRSPHVSRQESSSQQDGWSCHVSPRVNTDRCLWPGKSLTMVLLYLLSLQHVCHQEQESTMFVLHQKTPLAS